MSSMKLEIGSIHVRDVEVGISTALRDRTLVVDVEELRRLVLDDSHFTDARVRIVKPGESVRIIHALDVVEPRWKVAGAGGVFPGFVSPPTTVGEGCTQRLAGVAVVEVGAPVPGESTVFRERLIDMAGPGAELSPFGRTFNVVLELTPNMAFFPPGSEVIEDFLTGGPESNEYNRAVQAAGLKIAAHLARAAREVAPDDVETFELGPCDPALPRVVCLQQEVTLTPFIYGVCVSLPLGTMLHPNEYFDGAVVRWNRGYVGSTYREQNHPTLIELCRRHGHDVNFVGCIEFGGVTVSAADKEASSSSVSKMARLLRADAAMVIGLNGSNHAVDLMLTIQKLERAGIKTTLVYNDVGEGPDDPGFIFAVPEADAIVSAGSRSRLVTLPKMTALIGGDHLVDPEIDARGELTVPMRYLHGAVDPHGSSRQTVRYE
jgi:glycine reductase complex component B subunit alpha and beta